MIKEKYNLIITLGFIWVVIVIIGWHTNYTLNKERVMPTWCAAHAMVKNHKISASDLNEPVGLRFAAVMPAKEDLLGKYLLNDKKALAPIESKDVASRPRLEAEQVGTGNELIAYPLSDKELILADVANIGMQVKLCILKTIKTNNNTSTESECTDSVLRIAAVLPHTNDDKKNIALMLSYPQSSIKKLTPFMLSDKRMLTLVPAEK
jgi:hypothetical protein